MKSFKSFWKKNSVYFVDIWQYLIIIVIFIIAGIIYLIVN